MFRNTSDIDDLSFYIHFTELILFVNYLNQKKGVHDKGKYLLKIFVEISLKTRVVIILE